MQTIIDCHFLDCTRKVIFKNPALPTALNLEMRRYRFCWRSSLMSSGYYLSTSSSHFIMKKVIHLLKTCVWAHTGILSKRSHMNANRSLEILIILEEWEPLICFHHVIYTVLFHRIAFYRYVAPRSYLECPNLRSQSSFLDVALL